MMNIRIAVTLLAMAMTGCATTPPLSKTSSTPSVPANDQAAVSSGAATARRVALPYTFTRHGIEVRVNSIEATGGQVLVSVSLQETRGQDTELLVSTLTQVVTAAGQSLPYIQYRRADKIEKNPTIQLKARDQFSISLIYQGEAGSSEASNRSLELRFPTGKFWDSKVAD